MEAVLVEDDPVKGELEAAGLSGVAEKVAELPEAEAVEFLYLLWDPHRSVPTEERKKNADNWGDKQARDFPPEGKVALAAAWYIAADSAWVTSAFRSGAITREAFLQKWEAAGFVVATKSAPAPEKTRTTGGKG